MRHEMRHEVTLAANVWSRHAWLQAMHVLIRWAWLACALVSRNASAEEG